MSKLNLKPKATKLKEAGMGFLIALLAYFVLYSFIPLSADVILFFWLWAIGTFVVSKIDDHTVKRIRNNNALTITSLIEEVQYGKADEKSGREILRVELYPRVISFEQYLSEKSNNNITISGGAGSGKTTLQYYIINMMDNFKRIIFQFDPQDHYKNMGIPTLFLKKYSPNVFKDPNSLASAWETAFQGDATTYKAIPDIVKNLAVKSSNWQEFKKNLETEISQLNKADIITVGAYNAIQRQLTRVYKEKLIDYDIPENLVIDFEGLDDRGFIFYADWILRMLFSELQQENSRRQNTMIFIDEAKQFQNADNPILPKIMALIRKRGALLLSTQFISDLQGMRGNAQTQFAFYSNEGKDLDTASKISEAYHWILQRLHPFEFLDLAQSDSHNGIFVFRLFNPEPNFQDVVEWKPEMTEGQEEYEADTDKDTTPLKISNDTILEALNAPMNQQDLAKLFTKRYGQDVNYWKMRLKGILKTMVTQNEINAKNTDFVKFSKGKAYEVKDSIIYYTKDSYSYHDWLVERTAEILRIKGYEPEIQEHGVSTADIICENEKLAFEIETGTKQGYKLEETKGRFEKYQKNGYEVYVIVPNEETKAKYGEYQAMTVLELYEKLNQKKVLKND